MKRFVLSLFAAIALIALARAATLEPIIHEATEKKTSATVKTTGVLKVLLPGKPEAGHRWQIVSNDPRYLRPQGDAKPSTTAKSADGSVPWEVSFVGQRPGRVSVRFIWAKEGSSDTATPEDVREVNVRITDYLRSE